MNDARTLEYLNAARDTLANPDNRILGDTMCPECGSRSGDDDFSTPDHWVLPDASREGDLVPVIGCEGYWIVNPSAVGIENPNWSGIPGLNV